jgi:hypothetical protein
MKIITYIYHRILLSLLFTILFANLFLALPVTASKLLFKSGFEDGVTLGKPYNDGGGTWYQKLQGSDISGYSWPINIWSATGAFQVLVDSSLNSEEYIQNSIITMEGHNGNPTKVMHSKILKADKGWTQDPYIIEDAIENGDLYVKYWMKFPDNLPELLGDGTNDDGWCTFFEWKTAGDYRIAAYVYIEQDKKPYWYAHGDNVAKDNFGPYKEFWFEENKRIPVPENKWFLCEFFWHRSTKNDGRFWWAVNKNVIVDHYGPNKLEKNINRIMLFTVYAGKYPFEQWVDDIEIRDGFEDIPPVVANHIQDLELLKNAKKGTINLKDVFNDPDNENNAITIKVFSNSNPSLVSTSLSGDILNLEYTPNKTGSAEIVIAATSNGITVYDNFTITISDEKITIGSKSIVNINEIPEMNGPFTRTPKIYGIYQDPIKLQEKEVSTKGVFKINNSNPLNIFEFIWSKKISLYDKHSLSAANKNGTRTEDWLTQNPINPLKCDLYINTISSNSTPIDSKFRLSLIVPPEIFSIKTDTGANPANGISNESTLIIKGMYFGEKLPKVKLEYINPKGKIKFYKLKVLRLFKYADAKGNFGKSCMDVKTGISQISVSIKKNIPPGSYSLILSNKIGIATNSDNQELPIIKIITK